MGNQFNIRSQKARALAAELAARKNMTLAQIVEYALEQVKVQEAVIQTTQQVARDTAFERLKRMGDENRNHLIATGGKISSDHSELYDDNGLPI